MKLALITPTSALRDFAVQSDGIHLCLVQEVLRDPMYAAFYRERGSEHGDTIILDNGTFECGKPASIADILKAAQAVNANIVVAPDYPGSPCADTFRAAVEFAKSLPDQYRMMIVPQSRVGDVRDWLEGMEALLCVDQKVTAILDPIIDRVGMVGVSILSCPNAFGPMLGDMEPEICRFTAFQVLKHTLTWRNEMSSIKIHCLGGGSRLDLIRYYDWAYSMDTSSPVWHGWFGIAYELGFLPSGKIKTPVNFQADCPDLYKGVIQKNIRQLKLSARQAADTAIRSAAALEEVGPCNQDSISKFDSR